VEVLLKQYDTNGTYLHPLLDTPHHAIPFVGMVDLIFKSKALTSMFRFFRLFLNLFLVSNPYFERCNILCIIDHFFQTLIRYFITVMARQVISSLIFFLSFCFSFSEARLSCSSAVTYVYLY
jgi:hypothetical protein